MIRLTSVHKTFGQRVAVDDLNLRVPRGEIFGLLGHNGAGKSTAIGMMLGQVWPTQGEVVVCGQDVTRRRQFALQTVGAIFETPVFYDYLSGWRNLEILSHYTAPTPRARIGEVIDWVGLTGRERSNVRTYSHGMRARLALAQALLPRPELLILDEPSDGLDPEGIHEMRQTIRRLHGDLGLTIFLSSHLLNEVEAVADRMMIIGDGRMQAQGTRAELLTESGTIVEADDLATLDAVLHNAGLATHRADGDRRLVKAEPEVVARLAMANDVVLRRLAPAEDAGLERLFFELTNLAGAAA